MTDQITVPRETWDSTWGALKEAESRLALLIERDQHKLLDVVARDKAREALTSANAVSHPKPETAPVKEGGAITSGSAANAVRDHFPDATKMVQPQAQGLTPESARAMVAEMDMNDRVLAAIDAPKRLGRLKLLMVTTAYEQGVGKGIQRVSVNPYVESTDEHDAWALGYAKGLESPKVSHPSE